MVRMLRRVFRLGLVAGAGVGLLKALKGRKASDPWADSWVSTGPPGGTRPSAAPITPAAPKPPAPASTASATLATPPPATPKPPAPPASSADSHPPATAPAPPPPAAATGGDHGGSADAEGESETGGGDGDSKEADRAGGDAGLPESIAGKGSTGRPTKSSRKGPARKSPTGKAEEPPGERLWVPAIDGVCPQSHPVKAKLSSKIFHMPSGRNYGRTRADRCYPDEASAQADGLRSALR